MNAVALGELDKLISEWESASTWQKQLDLLQAALHADNGAQLQVLSAAAAQAGTQEGILTRTKSTRKLDVSRRAATQASEEAARALARTVSTKEAELEAAKLEALQAAEEAHRFTQQAKSGRLLNEKKDYRDMLESESGSSFNFFPFPVSFARVFSHFRSSLGQRQSIFSSSSRQSSSGSSSSATISWCSTRRSRTLRLR